MSRPNIDFTLPYAVQVFSTANLKKYVPEVLHNIEFALEEQFKRFSSIMLKDDLEKLSLDLSALKNIPIQSSDKSSVIICTNFTYIPFVIWDMDMRVINDMVETFEICSNEYEVYPPTYISTIYIFQSHSLLLKTDIAPHILAQLMAVFKSENLISFDGAREDWYIKPRRSKK